MPRFAYVYLPALERFVPNTCLHKLNSARSQENNTKTNCRRGSDETVQRRLVFISRKMMSIIETTG